MIQINYEDVEKALDGIKSRIMKNHTYEETEIIFDPLKYHVYQPYTSIGFLTYLVEANSRKLTTIAKYLSKGNSACETINQIYKYMGFECGMYGWDIRKGSYVDIQTKYSSTMVKVEKIFRSKANAIKAGFNKPTSYKNPKYGLLGKRLNEYEIIFAGYKK